MAATYVQTHNLKRKITKAKPCLTPVKAYLSGNTLNKSVTIKLLKERGKISKISKEFSDIFKKKA